MLYYLFYDKLYPFFSPFRVFRYLTFRTAFASITALVICVVLGPWLIRRLDLATGIAAQLRDDAARILQPLSENPNPAI